MLASFISKKRIRSRKTAETYQGALKVWARSRGFEEPDLAVQEIQEKHLDIYEVLQDFVNHLHGEGKAPKTTWTYFAALKAFLIDSDFEISDSKLRGKVTLPAKYDLSIDQAPTREEVKKIMLRSKLDTKAAIAMLASSGMRIGELVSLTVSDISFGEPGQPSKITLKAAMTKTRKRRLTYISGEGTELLREYLGDRIKDPDAKLFSAGQDALYMKLMRATDRAGLKRKVDKESRRFALHPHCYRKYFFSNMLSAGIDRGITEGFMGHRFGEDSAYLRMSDKELLEQYSKAADRLTFLTSENSGALKSRMEQLEDENKDLKARLEKLEALSVERLVLAARTARQATPKKRKQSTRNE